MKVYTIAILITQLFAVLLIIAETRGDGSHDCGPNETWNDCGTPCAKTCENRHQLYACAAVCAPGCFCNENYIRQSKNGPCIPNCPSA